MPNRRGVLFLVLAVVLALAATLAARRWLESQRPDAPARTEAARTASVVVARTELPVGSAVQAHQLATVDWPERYVPKGAFRDPKALEGRVVRRPVAADEPVLEAALLPAGAQAGLVSVISESRRAVSVKVDSVIGVAGFVQPGTRVDVIAILRRLDSQEKLPYSKVVLQDVPVLAVDQQLEQANGSEPKLVNVVTLEVDPDDAQKLVYSAHQGQLQLALRNPGDRDQVESQNIGVADLLGLERPARRTAGRPRVQVQLLRGAEVSVESF